MVVKYGQEIIHFFCRPCGEYHLKTHPHYRAANRRAAIESIVEQVKDLIQKHGGDVRSSLATAAHDGVRRSLAGVDDADIRRSVAELPPVDGHLLLSTVKLELQPAQATRIDMANAFSSAFQR